MIVIERKAIFHRWRIKPGKSRKRVKKMGSIEIPPLRLLAL